MNPDRNTVEIQVDNFQMKIDAKAHAKALFVSADGDATIAITIRKFYFAVSPKLRQDGPFNDIDFDILGLSLDIPSDGMHFEHLSIGIIPDFLMKPFANLIFEIINGQFRVFEGVIADAAKTAINTFKNFIPNHIDIPDSPFAISLSVPEIPKFGQEKSFIFMDG